MPFHFVNITDPGQEISADIRSHVMQDFVRRKQSKKNHERSLGRSAKQNQTQSRFAKLRPQKITVSELDSDPEENSQHSVLHSSPRENAPRATTNRRSRIEQYKCHNEPDEQTGQQQDEEEFIYKMVLLLSETGPELCIGCEIDPFHILPQLPNCGVNVERMKKYCGIFFGSDELTRYWAPTILKAPHAFFSCMCLGASHLDIMRGLQDESLTTISLKSAVIQEINNNLVGPANKVTDLTLIAISQIVAAEVVNGDQHALRIHTKGLEMIVQQRGGLQNLGMDGLVAIIVSIMVFLACIIRGVQPHSMYTIFFSCRLPPCSSTETIPESPLYCPRSDFFTILQGRHFSQEIYDLLWDMRDLTTIFLLVTEPDMVGPSEGTQLPASTPPSIIARSLARQPATLPGTPVWNDWVYESCRLASLIYSHMLCHRLSLPGAVSVPFYDPLVQELQAAIAKTDLSDCWGDMNGVLLWCTLVGGAAMLDDAENSDMKGLEWDDSNGKKTESCKRWLAILLVRLCVVIGFEHAAAVNTTLRRFIRIRYSSLEP